MGVGVGEGLTKGSSAPTRSCPAVAAHPIRVNPATAANRAVEIPTFHKVSRGCAGMGGGAVWGLRRAGR